MADKKKKSAAVRLLTVLLIFCIMLSGCGSGGKTESGSPEDVKKTESLSQAPAPSFSDRTLTGTMDPQYAEFFQVYYYDDGSRVIRAGDSEELLICGSRGVPEDRPDTLTVLPSNPERIYLAASAAMAFFNSADALSKIRFSGTSEENWYIENAKEAMRKGEILFAGKYNAPDLELLKAEQCDLAVESTMIYHSPKIKEMLEALSIPVFIDCSSYEKDPLGRAEWVRLYGVLCGREEEADRFFKEETEKLSFLSGLPNTGKKAAFFYISTAGAAVVRASDDYIPHMIERAGGQYVFEDLSGSGSNGSVSLSMEQFLKEARDADYLIYNASIRDGISSLEDLTSVDPLLKSFRAVQEGNVWITGKYMYQATDSTAQMILDMHEMLTDGDEEKTVFLKRLR